MDMIIRSGTDQVMIHTFNKRKLSSCWSIHIHICTYRGTHTYILYVNLYIQCIYDIYIYLVYTFMYIQCLRDLPLPIPPSSRSPRCGRNWKNPLRRAKPTTGLLGFDSVMGVAENSCWACSRWGAVNFHESPVRNSDNTGQYQSNEVEDCLYFLGWSTMGKF